MNDGSLTKWLRLVLAATMAIAVGMAIGSNPTTAVDLGPANGFTTVRTSMELEDDPLDTGNKVVDGTYLATSFDWNSILPEFGGSGRGPYNTVASGPITSKQSLGVVDTSFGYDVAPGEGDADACDGSDPSGLPGSQTIANFPLVIAPENNVNNKGDICSGGAAVEVIEENGNYRYVLYQYWTRQPISGGNSGEFNIFQILQGPEDGRCDDLAIWYDYASNQQVVENISVLEWTSEICNAGGGDPWASSSLDVNAYAGNTGFNVDVPSGPGNVVGSFGESAVDLTAAGILPTDECSTFTLAGFVSTTSNNGNPNGQQMLDVFTYPDPIVIDTCADVYIEKDAQPADLTEPAAFNYLLAQQEAPNPNQYPGTLTVPTSPSVTRSDVVAGPSYGIIEQTPAAPWTNTGVSCVAYDPVTDTWPTYTYLPAQNPAAPPFPVAPPITLEGAAPAPDGVPAGAVAACTLVNRASSINIEKVGSGNQTSFQFNHDFGTGSSTVPLNDASPTTLVAAGTYTITEVIPTGTGQPAWNLESILCFRNGDDTDVVATTGTPPSVNVPVGVGESVTCRFTNVQEAALFVGKTGQPDDGTSFGFDTDVDGNLDGTADLNAVINGEAVRVEGAAAGDTVTINEITPDDWQLGSVTCEVLGGQNSQQGSTFDVTGTVADAIVNLASGETVLCTFDNTKNGTITIDKVSVDGDDTFGFTGPGALTGSITTSGGVGTTTLSQSVAPGQYRIDEVLNDNYDLTNISCVDPTGAPTPDATGALVDVAPGETVSCTFTNTRKQATFTLAKTWGLETPDGIAVDLDASATGPGPLGGPIAVTATSFAAVSDYEPADPAERTMTIYSGQTIEFSETFLSGQGNAFNTVLDCGGLGTMALTPDGDRRGGTIVVGSDPVDATCTLDNIPKVAGVTLFKSWVDARSGETAGLELSTAPTGETDSAQSVAPAVPSEENSAIVPVVVGDVVTFTEAVSNDQNYTTTFDCALGDAPHNDPVKVDDYTYTLLIDVDDVAAQKAIACRFVNTRISVDLTVEKDWINAKIGDAVAITSTGSLNDVDFTSVAGPDGDNPVTETDVDPTTYKVYAGETLNFSETFDVGDPAAYDATFSCTGPDSATDEILTVDPAAAGAGITCTYENDRRSFEVRAAKTLLPTTDDGLFNLLINGEQLVTDGGDTAITIPGKQIFVGDLVTVAEMAGTGSTLDHYDSVVSCDQGITLNPNNGTSGSFTMPASLRDEAGGVPGVVICTFTNQRRSASLTVVKDWVDSPENGDTVSLDITPGPVTQNVVTGTDSNDGVANDTNGTATVFAGEEITVTESFDVGDPANYDISLVCTDSNGDLVGPSDLTTAPFDGTFTVPDVPTAITCTFENVRKRTDLTLRKTWILSSVGDTADLTITGEDAASPATAQSVSTGGTFPDHVDNGTNIASLTVYAGETVDLDEVVSPSANYTSVLSCDSPTNTETGAGRSWDLLIDPADADGNGIVCTFLNSRKTTTVQLVKHWDTSPANDDAVALTITGSENQITASDGADSNDGDDTNDSIASVTALAGETITLTEAFGPGDPVNYDKDLECVGAADVDDLTYTADALTGDLFIDPTTAATTIVCTFTNTRKSADFELAKTWVKSVDGDLVELSFTGTDDPAPVDAEAPASDGTTTAAASQNGPLTATVYAGETITVAEDFAPHAGTNTATYDLTNFECDGTDDAGWGAGDLSTDLAITAADVEAARDAGVAISCTFTNAAQRGNIVIVKAIDGVNDGTFPFTGDWSAEGAIIDPDTVTDPADFSITTSGLNGSVTFTDVLVGSFQVSETDAGAEFDGTSVVCVETNGDDGSSPTTPSTPLTGDIDLDNGETVTCTFTNTEKATIVIVKDARPDSAQNFSFTGDLGEFTLDDDADSTLSNTFTSDLLNAEAGSTYAVDETSTPGWTLDLDASSCSNGDAFAGSGVVIDPAPGTTVTCTFVNNANPAGLSATKQVDGQVGPWGPFEFTLSGGSFSGEATQAVDSTGPTADWTDLVEGEQYTLTEAQVPGYEADAEFVCSVILPGQDAQPLADADGATPGFQFTAVAGAVYDCDITNVAIPGEVDVTKSVTGVAGEYEWSFEFTIDPVPVSDPAQPASQDATGTGNTTSTAVSWTDLVPGTTYTITETSIPGWTAGDIECTVTPADETADPVVTTDGSFAVTPGSTVSCDFDNAADPGDVSVTKSVTGVAAEYEWSFEFTIDPVPVSDPAQPASQDATGTGNTTSTAVTWTDLVPGTTYTITETSIPGWTAGDIDCTVTAADGSTSDLTIASFSVEPGDSISCDFDNAADPGDVSVTKTVLGVDEELDWAFDFTIDPFEGDVAPSATQTASGTGNETSSPLTWTGLLPGESYTITETVPAGWTQGPISCTISGADGSSTPLTAATFTVEPGDSISCDFDNSVNPSEVSVTKTVNGGLDPEQAWAFEFTLTPDANPVGSQTASGTGDGNDTVTWTNLVPGEEYVLAEVLPGSNPTAYLNGVLTCTGVDDLDGDDQTVTFVAPLGGEGVEVQCAVTNTALSDVDYAKNVASVDRDADTGVWTITYEIDVTNAADAGEGIYDLYDQFQFGDGVTIVDGSASVANTAPGTIVTEGDFDGEGNTTVVLGEIIAAGATHTYLVSVDVTIVVGPDTDGDCDGEEGEGTGFLNSTIIVVDSDEREPATACAGFAQLTLVKDLVNDDGGNGTLADFPLTATGPAVLSGVSGTAAVSSAVPAGDYDLSEEQLVEGYVAGDWACEGGSLEGSTVGLIEGDNATCTIVNDDEPVDLELTKDDGGIEAVAGGAPFDYTITVQNIGDRDVDLDEPVTVTDTLPNPLRWVSFPANCSQAGQVLTCDIDPALLPAGGDPVVITATVRAPADAPSGTFTNKASVTTEDDPSTNPPCPALQDNNVDCEETPVDRQGAVQITKTDDVANGASVQPGETFTYKLVVKNTGVSTLLPGLNVTDDLPAELEFVSAVGGTGWSCNASDPIDCTYAPSLAPGATAPTITVTVLVAEDASAELIENVAVVRAAVDRDCPTATSRLVEAFQPACNEVTDDDDETTPLNPNADLAIIKTASVAQVGAGGGFSYTLDITNNGPGTAVDVVIGDVVPSRLVVTGVSSSDFDCGRSGNSVECTIDSLAVGDGGTVTITVTVPTNDAGGDVTNIGTVESSTPDPDLTNNSDDAVVVIVAIAPPTTTIPVTLPETGSNLTVDMVRAATLLLLLGGAVILITRRRRTDEVAGG